MGISYHPAKSRGHVNFGWLDSKHTFSFGQYYNPKMMGFGKIRVINDDVVEAGKGFDTHSHQDMEIVSIPLQGRLEHKDTLGNGSIITDDEVQLMSAGSGISHSEFNPSESAPLNFLQIWILPNENDLVPSYQQKRFKKHNRVDYFQCVVSPDGREDSLNIHQQVYFSLLEIHKQTRPVYRPYMKMSGVYCFVIEGQCEIDGHQLNPRDGLAISETDEIHIIGQSGTKLLIIETTLD